MLLWHWMTGQFRMPRDADEDGLPTCQRLPGDVNDTVAAVMAQELRAAAGRGYPAQVGYIVLKVMSPPARELHALEVSCRNAGLDWDLANTGEESRNSFTGGGHTLPVYVATVQLPAGTSPNPRPRRKQRGARGV